MRKTELFISLIVAWVILGSNAWSQMVPVDANLRRLVAQEDTDGDLKITVLDRTTPFSIYDKHGKEADTLTNFYRMSVLMQELKLAEQRGNLEMPLTSLELDESVVARTHRLIKESYWDALTRRIDAQHLEEVVQDPKTWAKHDYLYLPGGDAEAVEYFQALQNSNLLPSLKVVVLPPPEEITGEFVRHLDSVHGLLSLKLEHDAAGQPVRGVPYVVPGGRFNELYCWDSYFILLGLLEDGRIDLARGMADNLLYEVQFYGKIPNANRTYYLTRSQPPFLTSIVRAVFETGAVDKAWLTSALKTTLAEYRNVWLGKDRLVKIGKYELSRYYDEGFGPCPEVEPGHYDEKLQPWLKQVEVSGSDVALTPHWFLNQYLFCNQYADLGADGMSLEDFFKHDRAVRESGHDTTHRFDDRTADFISVDLNTLLYQYEMDFAELIESQFGGDLRGVGKEYSSATSWRKRAAARKAAVMDLMWDEERGYFFDYDFVRKRRSTYISATGLYPLWAKMLDASDAKEVERAKRVASYACEKLEQFAGLSATAKESVESARYPDVRQWDYPFGWAPHQMLAWKGMENYGLKEDASRLAYRWLYTIAKNAHDYNGTVPEKYNVVTGSHMVFAEYGNVGTKFSYIATEGFGWMNASFEVGMNYLTAKQASDLNRLVPISTK